MYSTLHDGCRDDTHVDGGREREDENKRHTRHGMWVFIYRERFFTCLYVF